MADVHALPIQDLSRFRLPPGFRGRAAWVVQLWWIVQASLFRCSPQACYAWRRWLLRLFGASVGRHARIRPTAEITYPWKVTIGDWAVIGDEVVLYSLAEIRVGEHAVISQRSYVCTGSHDYSSASFDIVAEPVTIGAQSWLASDVFVAPGVRVGEGAVVGARSTVLSDLPPMTVCIGTPAVPVRSREGRLDG